MVPPINTQTSSRRIREPHPHFPADDSEGYKPVYPDKKVGKLEVRNIAPGKLYISGLEGPEGRTELTFRGNMTGVYSFWPTIDDEDRGRWGRIDANGNAYDGKPVTEEEIKNGLLEELAGRLFSEENFVLEI